MTPPARVGTSDYLKPLVSLGGFLDKGGTFLSVASAWSFLQLKMETVGIRECLVVLLGGFALGIFGDGGGGRGGVATEALRASPEGTLFQPRV